MTGKEPLTSEASMRGVVKEGREAGPLAEGSGSGQLDDLVLTVGVERRAREERHAGRSQRVSQLREQDAAGRVQGLDVPDAVGSAGHMLGHRVADSLIGQRQADMTHGPDRAATATMVRHEAL